MPRSAAICVRGRSGRAIERKYGVGRRTIVAAMSSAWPAARKALPPRASKLDPFEPVIDAILRTDLDVGTLGQRPYRGRDDEQRVGVEIEDQLDAQLDIGVTGEVPAGRRRQRRPQTAHHPETDRPRPDRAEVDRAARVVLVQADPLQRAPDDVPGGDAERDGHLPGHAGP